MSGSLDGLTSAERTVVNDLLTKGKNVEIIPTSTVSGAKTPDFLVNGVKTELKTLQNPNTNTGMKRIQEAFKQGAETVIIDARESGIGSTQAQEIINRVDDVIKGSSKAGTLSNLETRQWYLQQEAKIPELINKNASLEEQARQAFDLRNQFRTQARELMSDRDLAASLNKTDPNLTWEQVVQKYTEKGFQGDDLYREIVNSAQRSRTSVNKSLGIE